MANLSDFAGIGSRLSEPDALFRGSEYRNIGSDPDLTQFLRRKLAASGYYGLESAAAVREAVISEAERMRGDLIWRTLFGIPREAPHGLEDHQLRNLYERLYLSSPAGYGKKPLYGDDAAASGLREERLMQRGAVLAMALLVPTSGFLWLLRRRGTVGGAQGARGMFGSSAKTDKSQSAPARPSTMLVGARKASVASNLSERVPSAGAIKAGPTAAPWARFFARQLDMLIGLSFLGGGLAFWLGASGVGESWHAGQEHVFWLTANLALIPLYLVIEGVVVGLIGTTPAKFALGLKVVRRGGGRLTMSQAVSRAVLLWWGGLGFGVFGLFTLIWSYARLRGLRQATWYDEKAAVEVIGRPSAGNIVLYLALWGALVGIHLGLAFLASAVA